MATEDNVPALDEEAIYAEALLELKSGTVRPGLWAKAFAESEGDESKSQALYIRLRVQHEKERRRHLQNAAVASAAESVRRSAEKFSAVIEQLRIKGYEARKSGDGWIVREPLGGRAKLDSDESLLEYAAGRVSVTSRRQGSSDKRVASPTGKEGQPDQEPSTQPSGAHLPEAVSVSSESTSISVVTEGKKGETAPTSIRRSRWRIALHLWAGVCLKAAADVSGVLSVRGGATVEEARAAATGAALITVLLFAVGYYLSYQFASALDRTALVPAKKKAILIALPIAYFAFAILVGGTVGLIAGTAR